LPDFVHDICFAVHPLALGSPFFSKLPLTKYGLEFINQPTALAHPFHDGTAVLLHRSVELTAAGLGRDAQAYEQVIRPFAESWDDLAEDLLSPPGIPRHLSSWRGSVFMGFDPQKVLLKVYSAKRKPVRSLQA
jgi:phytoene dehydrogenase-like protein